MVVSSVKSGRKIQHTSDEGTVVLQMSDAGDSGTTDV